MSTEDHPDWWEPMGGQNSQDSILERRSLIWNDDGILDGTVPDTFYTDKDHVGKFYTRGCRGMLEQIQVYCIREGVGSLVLRYSPHPCIGPFGEVTIVPGVAWGWVDVDIEEMWNYDSLFIWVRTCSADVSWAYDAVLPYDGHESEDTGATWADMAIRPFIRAVYTGETPGDVPVSGIVNVIRMPNVSVEVSFPDPALVLTGVYTQVAFAEGAGELIEAIIRFTTVVVPAAVVEYRLRLVIDGVDTIIVGNRQVTQSVIAAFGRCALGEFLQDGTYTWLWVRLPIQYRRSIGLEAYQSTGGGVITQGTLIANELV